jgi:hypothetical protein
LEYAKELPTEEKSETPYNSNRFRDRREISRNLGRGIMKQSVAKWGSRTPIQISSLSFIPLLTRTTLP